MEGESTFLGASLLPPRGWTPDWTPCVSMSLIRRFLLVRALNSAVECHPHTVEVVGSNPTAPTIPISPELMHIGMMVLDHKQTIDEFMEWVSNCPTLGETCKYAAYEGIGNLADHETREG
jgi:hypothetical protein